MKMLRIEMGKWEEMGRKWKRYLCMYGSYKVTGKNVCSDIYEKNCFCQKNDSSVRLDDLVDFLLADWALFVDDL